MKKVFSLITLFLSTLVAISQNPNGITIAGGNGQGLAANQLTGPEGMFIDNTGNYFIADTYNHRIQKWTPGSTQGITVAGGNGNGSAANQLSYPRRLFIDSIGTIYIADKGNHRIQKWVVGATQGSTVAGGKGEGWTPAQLDNPTSVAVNKRGEIFITDVSSRIQKWNPYATKGVTLPSSNIQLSGLTDIFLDSLENIYISQRNQNRILKQLPNTSEWIVVAGNNGYGRASNQIGAPEGIYVDQVGTIYSTDLGNRIQKWYSGATTGITVAGGNGDGNAPNQLFNPLDVSVDPLGNIFVVDKYNNRVQKFETTNLTASISGSNSIAPGQSSNLVITLTGASPWNVVVNGIAYNNITSSPLIIPVSPAQTTDYTITSVSNSSGNGIVRGTAKVTVTPCPSTKATIDGSTSIYYGESVPITVYLSGTAPWSVTLDGTTYNNITTSPKIINIVPTATKRYTLTSVMDNCGSGKTEGIVEVIVKPNCLPDGSTVAGDNGYGSLPNQLSWATKPFISKDGSLYIVDQGNDRIQKWLPNAKVGLTVA